MSAPSFEELGSTLEYRKPDKERAAKHAAAQREIDLLVDAWKDLTSRQVDYQGWQQYVMGAHRELCTFFDGPSPRGAQAIDLLSHIRMAGMAIIGGKRLGAVEWTTFGDLKMMELQNLLHQHIALS